MHLASQLSIYELLMCCCSNENTINTVSKNQINVKLIHKIHFLIETIIFF